MTGEDPDHNLQLSWKRFLEGDTNAFPLIYKKNPPKLLNYGYKLCREKELVHDAVQEFFTGLFQKRGKPHTPVHALRLPSCLEVPTWRHHRCGGM